MDTEPVTPAPVTEIPPQPTPVPAVPAPQPVTPAMHIPKVSKNIIIAVIATVLLVTGVVVGLSSMKPKETAALPTPTPTPIATPTPIRQPSKLAGTAEFQLFQSAVATLSAAIAGYNPLDSTLTPPTLVLPLGFGQ